MPSCCSQTCVGGPSGTSITGEGQGTGGAGSLLRPGGEDGSSGVLLLSPLIVLSHSWPLAGVGWETVVLC